MVTKEGLWVRGSFDNIFVMLMGIIWLKGENGCSREKSTKAKGLEEKGRMRPRAQEEGLTFNRMDM